MRIQAKYSALFLLLLLGFAFTINGQNRSVLSAADLKKEAKANESIAEAKKFITQSDDLLKNIEKLQTRGNKRVRDSLSIVRKYQRTRLKALDGIDAGYLSLYKIYSKAIKKANVIALNSKVDNMLAGAVLNHNVGREQLGKVSNEMDHSKSVKSLDLGINSEKIATSMLLDAIDLLEGGVGRNEVIASLNSPEVKVEVVNVDSLISKPSLAAVMPMAMLPTRIDSASFEVNEVKSYDDAKTFFSIQISASKTKLSEAEISSLYRGKFIVVLIEADGYYRYSVGKFLTLNDAQITVEKEQIKGYIVGYVKYKRASIAEVTKALVSN